MEESVKVHRGAKVKANILTFPFITKAPCKVLGLLGSGKLRPANDKPHYQTRIL